MTEAATLVGCRHPRSSVCPSDNLGAQCTAGGIHIHESRTERRIPLVVPEHVE
jgi:hypothetical protein